MNDLITYASLEQTPIGPIWLAASGKGLLAVHIGGSENEFKAEVERLSGQTPARDEAPTANGAAQLASYLGGRRTTFDIVLDTSTFSDFQTQALALVRDIPYGATRTYLELAKEMGRPGAARAVGRANATNSLPIFIPCHRVLGSDGGLHGYGGGNGIETKAWLLRLEGSRLL